MPTTILAVCLLTLAACASLVGCPAPNSTPDPTPDGFVLETVCGVDNAEDPELADRDDVYERYCVQDAPSRDAVCNDGTTPVYYVDRVEGSDRWLVYFQGGKACNSVESCAQRLIDSPHLMSTDHPRHRRYRQLDGFLGADPENNPTFAGWNRVHLSYCSSDGWAGARPADELVEWHMQGHAVVRAMFEDLLDERIHGTGHLGAASQIVLSGSSAGASGLRNNGDWLVDELLPGVDVRGLHDAGWIPPVWFLCSTPEDGCTSPSDLAEYAASWDVTLEWSQPVLDDSCVAEAPLGEEWRCVEAWSMAEHIELPLFVWMDQRDPTDMNKVGVDGAETSQIMAFANGVRESLEDREEGYFSTCRGHHEGMKSDLVATEVVDGLSYADAVANWLGGTGDTQRIETCQAP